MFKKVTCIFITITLLTVMITGCNNPDKATQENPQGFRLQSSALLDKNSDMYMKIVQSGAIEMYQSSAQAQFGTLNLDQAQVADYEGTTMKAIIIPIANKEEQRLSFIAYYNKEANSFKTFIMDVSSLIDISGDSKSQEDMLSGSIIIYSGDGTFVSSATFQDNQLINSQINTSRLNWGAFVNCFNNLWPTLPWWVHFACEITCSACVCGVIPSCVVCVACLGGYIGYCLWTTW